MGLEQQREIGWQEAAVHWYDFVYWPVVEQIRAEGILSSFPGRTETDLYLWIAAHHAAIVDELGWHIPQQAAAADLVAQFSEKPGDVAARLGSVLKEAVTPSVLESGPPVGHWRKERQQRRPDRLFQELLVPLDGGPNGWTALEQALRIAQREGGRIYGLHVKPPTSDTTERDEGIEPLYAEFAGRCGAAGVPGELAVVHGDIAENIRARARWADLIVAGLRFPPPAQGLSRWSSGFRSLIQRSPLPLLAVPNQIETLHHGLLAFNGSPKAHEALYVCAYLASRWGTNLTVLSVGENGDTAPETAAAARSYLRSYGVEADEIIAEGPVSEAIQAAQVSAGCDFIAMGGYHRAPVLEVMLGSEVDSVLRAAAVPVLICR
jgi:nucleotide-binding universal stress UspA family protein